MKKINVYMCCTPYSFLVAYYLAKKDPQKKILVLKKDFNTNWITNFFIDTEDTTFDDILFLSPSQFTNISSIKNIFKNRKKIYIFLKKYNIDTSFLPNPYIPEFTTIANKSRKKILFEEGIGLFKDSENDIHIPGYKKFIKKIIYGFGYTEINKDNNFLSYFDKVILSSKNFSQNMKVPTKLNIENFNIKEWFSVINKSDITVYLKKNFYKKKNKTIKIIVLLPNTNVSQEIPKDLKNYYKFLNNLQIKYKGKIFFKYHPREKILYFGEKNIYHLLPAEILLLIFQNVEIIIGISSTIMYNIKKINPQIKVISLLDYFNTPVENINKIFKKEGIIFPKNKQELYKLIK